MELVKMMIYSCKTGAQRRTSKQNEKKTATDDDDDDDGDENENCVKLNCFKNSSLSFTMIASQKA